jgi:hypothetical protein
MKTSFTVITAVAAALALTVAIALADALPSNYPLPTYAGTSGPTNVQHVIDRAGDNSLQYDVSDDMKVVVDWYRTRLQAQGFHIMIDMENKDASGITRGMVQWSRCENHHYSSVGVGSVASAGNPNTPDKPGAEITLQASKGGC